MLTLRALYPMPMPNGLRLTIRANLATYLNKKLPKPCLSIGRHGFVFEEKYWYFDCSPLPRSNTFDPSSNMTANSLNLANSHH